MPENTDLDLPDYDDSSPLENGDESDPNLEQPSAEDEVVEEPVAAPVAAAPVAPVADVAPQPAATAPTAPVHPGTVSPFAQGIITAERRAQLEQVFLPEQLDAIISLSSDIAQMQVRAFEQTQDIAADLGVPAQYMRDVKAYSDKVPEHMRGSKEGAQAAILLAMHERAANGGNLIEEFRRFVEAATPPQPATPAKPAPAPPEPLAPAARVTRSNVSGAAVAAAAPARTNGAGKRDPLEAKMPWLSKYLED